MRAHIYFGSEIKSNSTVVVLICFQIAVQLMAVLAIVAAMSFSSGTIAAEASDGLYHDNYGYVLKYKREIHVATFHAKLIFHFELPDWDVQFDDRPINCDANTTIIGCAQFREVLNSVRNIRADMQVYVQHQIRHIHELVRDLPIDMADRSKRGLLTQALSRITGLASQTDVQAVMHVLEQIEKGYYQASVLWGRGEKSLTAAFKLEQNRMQNVFDILAEYRQSIRQLQYDFMYTKRYSRRSYAVLMSMALQFLHNNTVSVSQVDALYNAVQILMTGNIPHFILPHDKLTFALKRIQRHLNDYQPHLMLSRYDYAFYYHEASFKTFRKGNIMFLMIDTPVTTGAFANPFSVYEVLKIPLPMSEIREFYCMLSTDISSIAYTRDADHILQLTNSVVPSDNVWHANDPAITIVNRSWVTCASALITGHLPDIKMFCRYSIHKPPLPKGVMRLFGNTFLLTNITKLQLHCWNQEFRGNNTLLNTELTQMISVHTFSCHCDKITADEFAIVADLDVCNNSNEISDTFNVQYVINLAYLSEYFELNDLFNLSADTLLNHSVEMRLPKLSVAEKKLDEQFAFEKAASFDMETIVNSTKNSASVYDDLAHYIFNQMATVDLDSEWDWFSPWSWATIIGWIVAGAALILVIRMHFKLRTLTMIFMARGTQAAVIPNIISLSTPTTASTTKQTVDIMAEWASHVSHVPSLLPVEVLLLLCVIFWILFKLACMIYRSHKAEVIKTRLVLEIGNETDSVLVPIMSLPHAMRLYRLVINKPEIDFQLTEFNFSGYLSWNRGVRLSNVVLDMPISLPATLSVKMWQLKTLKILLGGHFYAVIQIVPENAMMDTEIVVLRSSVDDVRRNSIYPSLN